MMSRNQHVLRNSGLLDAVSACQNYYQLNPGVSRESGLCTRGDVEGIVRRKVRTGTRSGAVSRQLIGKLLHVEVQWAGTGWLRTTRALVKVCTKVAR